MTDPIEAAQERLDKAAIVLGSLLIDELHVDWSTQTELEAACLEYVRLLRSSQPEQVKP